MKTIPPAVSEQAAVYFELLERYRELSAEKSAPLIGVRLLFLTHGMDLILDRMKTIPTEAMAATAMTYLQGMSSFLGKLLDNYPPPDEEMKAGVQSDIDEQKAAITPATEAAIIAFLDRVRIREDALHSQPRKVTH